MKKTTNEAQELMKVFQQMLKEGHFTVAPVDNRAIAVRVPGTENDAIVVYFSGSDYSFDCLVQMNQNRLEALIERTERWQAAALRSQNEAIERVNRHAQRLAEYRRQLDLIRG